MASMADTKVDLIQSNKTKARDAVSTGIQHAVFQVGEEPYYREFTDDKTFQEFGDQKAKAGEYVGAYHASSNSNSDKSASHVNEDSVFPAASAGVFNIHAEGYFNLELISALKNYDGGAHAEHGREVLNTLSTSDLFVIEIGNGKPRDVSSSSVTKEVIFEGENKVAIRAGSTQNFLGQKDIGTLCFTTRSSLVEFMQKAGLSDEADFFITRMPALDILERAASIDVGIVLDHLQPHEARFGKALPKFVSSLSADEKADIRALRDSRYSLGSTTGGRI